MSKQKAIIEEEKAVVEEVLQEGAETTEELKRLSRFQTITGDPILLFGRWGTQEVVISDRGLARYLTISPVYVPTSHGRMSKQQFYKSSMNILERLMNHMYVSGHRGKKHKISSGRNVGKSQRMWTLLEDILTVVEEKEGKNPVEVLIQAIVNSAPIEEAISFQRGGSLARKAVVIAPQRRIDLALRMLAQGAYENGFNKKKSAVQTWANEIVAAAKRDKNCKAIRERERREKEAEGAR